MWGWTKQGIYTYSSTGVFKTIAVFFSGKYGFSALPLFMIHSCPWRTSRFLESVSTILTKTSNKSQNFLPFSPSGAVSDTLKICSTLQFTTAVASEFCTIVATCALLLIMSSKLHVCGQNFVHAHTQLSRVYLVSTLYITHMIKCTRLSPSLVGKAWEKGWAAISKFPSSTKFLFI